MTLYQEPALDSWLALVEDFRRSSSADSFAQLRIEMRERVIDLARNYTAHLQQTAQDCGVELAAVSDLPEWKQSVPVVMSGHQPLIYHPGLLYKERSLEEFASRHSCLPIHVVIDTDEGDAGQLPFPWRGAPTATLRKEVDSLCSTPGLYKTQTIRSAESVREVFERVISSVNALKGGRPTAKLEEVAQWYQNLASQPVVAANSIVRWALRGRSHFEIPLSHILNVPCVQTILKQWLHDPSRMASVYNSVLNQFRLDRKIKNPANPFPNMNIADDSIELPFWIIDNRRGERRACKVSAGEELRIPDGSFLAPRGSIITLLLRGVCADLFVHGKGGAKYDPFVERFASEFLNLSLAPFVVASADVRFFPEQFEALEAAETLKEEYKDIVSHTNKFMGTGLFPTDAEHQLLPLLSERATSLKALASAQNPAEKSSAAHQLNAVNREVRKILDEFVFAERLKILSMPPETIDAWKSREYPTFILD